MDKAVLYRKNGCRIFDKRRRLFKKDMIDPELTIRKLEIFLAFMDKCNIARTAETLGISGVSMHRALHSLEEVLICPLFSRKTGAI